MFIDFVLSMFICMLWQINSFLNVVRTHVLFIVISDFLYSDKVLFRSAKMIYSHLIGSYVHYWRMRPVSVMVGEVWMI